MIRIAICAEFAILPPKWQAGRSVNAAELTLLHGGTLGCCRQCSGWLGSIRRCIFEVSLQRI
ncbi:MAG: hypothetical protein H0X30_26105 [Anaerolineae bacterium]|nr:hypothetical protein [Anaerolineae bacterium]